jgi:hypothetical protein
MRAFMQLRLTVSDRTGQYFRDFIVLVPFYIVKHEDDPIAGWKLSDGPLQRNTLN